MLNQTLARGLFLAVVALAFGLTALRYPLGNFTRAGPGLFPLLVSGLLLGIALITMVQSRLLAAKPLRINLRNLGFVLGGLGAFVVSAEWLNMVVAVVALVFISAGAGSTYSAIRNVKVAAVLIAIAWMFQHFLGLNLKLI